eukprot:scaffold7349_cov173-Amphora_coffeaeformis.AAC.144
MKVNLDYDEGSDSDDESLVEEKVEGKEEIVVASKEAVSRMQAVLSSTSTPETPPDNTSVHSDDSSISDRNLMGTSNPVTVLEEEDSWQFDLGVMENKMEKVAEQATKTSTFNKEETNGDDANSKVTMLSEELSVISLELEEADRAMKSLLLGKENDLKEFRRCAPGRSKSSDHATKGVLTPEFLEQRKQDRANRLARARERIARDKRTFQLREEEETTRLQEEETKKKEYDMSEEARRDRAYKWYGRCGQPNRKALKKKIAALQHKQGVSPEDVDLLPWNFNGTLVNVSQMISMQMDN